MRNLLTTIGLLLSIGVSANVSAPERITHHGQINPALTAGIERTASSENGRIMMNAPLRATTAPGVTLPQRASASAPELKSLSGAEFYGWLATPGVDDVSGGWYTLDADGEYKMQWTNKIVGLGINLVNGWVKDNRLCGLGSFVSGGLVLYYNYLEFDLKTGEPVTETPVGDDNLIHLSTYYLSSAYVPSEDRIYGYTYSDDGGSGYTFCSSPVDDIADVTVIKTLTENVERTSAICYNPEEDLFYGVNYNGDFVRIDRSGAETVIFRLPVETLRTDPTAIVYSPLDGCYIYCAYYYNYATQLYAVYPETKEVRFIRNFPSDFQFTFLMDPAQNYDSTAPGRPELTSYDVAPGALSGEIGYRLPATQANGDPLSGEVDWTFYIDNVISKTGKASAGAEIGISLQDIAQGTHVLRLTTSAAGKEGLSCVTRRYFGNGIPLAPENVMITPGKISWNPVTEAEFGAWLDLSQLKYDVYVNDTFVGSTSSTEYAHTLDASKQVSVYHAYVVAECKGLKSERAESNKLIYGAPIPLPYTITPTQEQFDLCHVFNLDGSPSYGEWDFSPARWHEPVFYSGWNEDTADDWLILPPVDCSDLSHAYRITLDAICGGTTSDEESFEIWCGASPDVESMTTLVMPKTSVYEFITEGWETFSGLFVPKTSGPCYIAIRCVSPPHQYSLIIRNIVIEATEEVAEIPAAPADLKFVSKSDADLTATLTFTLPTQTITGSPIPEDAEVKAVLRTGDKTAEKAALPGETVTMTVETSQGDNRIEALCSVNGQYGQSMSVSVFTGTIPPNYVENFLSEITEDNLGIRMSWSAPLKGQENLTGYYSPEGLHYWLYEQVYDPTWGEYSWEPVKDLGNVTEYTYTVSAEERLHVKYLGIVAANNGGKSAALSYTYREIGKPYASINENFSGGQPHYSPLRVLAGSDDYADSAWEIAQPEMINSGAWSARIPYALLGYTNSENGGRARVALPKVSTAGMERPVLVLTVWTGDGAGTLSAYALGYANQNSPQKIYDVPAYNDGWKTIMIDLPEAYCDKQWVEVQLDALIPGYYDFVMIGGYKICAAAESSVAGITAPDAAIAGGRGEVVAAGFAGEEIRVYGTDGRLAASVATASDLERIALQAGIYIVRIGDRQAKVAVR